MKVKMGIQLISFSLFLLLSSTIFPHHFSLAYQQIHMNNQTNQSPIFHSLVPSLLPLQGNVYPTGHYTVSIKIGNPPKPYELDIDTGSDITWLQCDAPCKSCTLPKEKQYKPSGNFVKRSEPICESIPQPGNSANPERCNYEIGYADDSSTQGALVRDSVSISTHGSALVAFGCGFNQKHSNLSPPPTTAGVLGLGYGETSILTQLSRAGLIRNVLGHCLSSGGGGYLSFGDGPPAGIVYTPIIHGSPQHHYVTGPADLLFNGQSTPAKGLQFIFDSGTTYTYFSSKVYNIVVNLVINDLKGKPLSRANDPTLPICWKGVKSFKSLDEVSNYFKPLTLTFTQSRNNVQCQLPPVAYLIISKFGNVCLGILNGAGIVKQDENLLGDISLQDKIVIYDNESQQIGWANANCNVKNHIQLS